VSAVDGEAAGQCTDLSSSRTDLGAFKFIGCYNSIHAMRLRVMTRWSMPQAQPTLLPLQQCFGEQFGHVFRAEIR
jgi:hypothetical protein